MSVTHALSPLPDAITKISCSYLDLGSLLRLDCVSSKFHALTPLIEKDLPKIRALVRNRGWHDIGISLISESNGESRIHPIGKESVIVDPFEADDPRMFLFRKGSTEKPLLFENESLAGKSEKRIFSLTNEKVHVRDPQGTLWCAIPYSDGCAVYPLSSSDGQERVLLSLNDRIEVWDISEKQAPKKIQSHKLLLPINDEILLGAVLAILTNRNGEEDRVTLFAFDLKNLEKRPTLISHPKHGRFYKKDHYSSNNSSHLFLQGEQNSLVAFKAINGTLEYMWEIPNPSGICCASEKWLIILRKDTAGFLNNLQVLELQTGEISMYKKRERSTLDFWGDNILSKRIGRNIDFFYLPEWRHIYTYEIEDTLKIEDISFQDDQLLILHKLSTEEQRATSLPIFISTQSENSSLCDKIYAAFSLLCSWLQALWQFITNKGCL